MVVPVNVVFAEYGMRGDFASLDEHAGLTKTSTKAALKIFARKQVFVVR